MNWYRLATVTLAFICTLASVSAADARRVHRTLFYTDTPFGSLAWVRGPATRSAARTKLTLEDLSGETCISLPGAGAQWFIINHHDEELAGQVGYFSVRILYEFAGGTPDAKTGIHLQRNSNWYDASGRQSVRDYQRSSEQIALTDSGFIALHDPVAGNEDARLAELEKAVGSWHMKPTADDQSSWADRYLYGPMLRAYLRTSSSAISARLIRFTATSSSGSRDPVLFWLDPRGATSATILVDAPRHTYAGSRRVYSVNFEDACP